MFETLFHYPRVLARHVNGPLADERRLYLQHRAQAGTPRSTLLRFANELLVVSSTLRWKPGRSIGARQLQSAANRWARKQRRRGRARSLHWSEVHYLQVANAWLKFLGWLKDKPVHRRSYHRVLEQWSSGLRDEGELAARTWADVQRLLARTDTGAPTAIRNRAILWLFAVYGLRSGEVAQLRLSDLDWSGHTLRVRRSKSAEVHEYPLTPTTRRLLQRYIKEVRPLCANEEVFLTRTAPFRRLSSGALYDLVQRLFGQLGIRSSQRGPHSLRHACATYLLNGGLSLKQVGDHLGHRHLGSTQAYAKVDLRALREISDFDLRGVA